MVFGSRNSKSKGKNEVNAVEKLSQPESYDMVQEFPDVRAANGMDSRTKEIHMRLLEHAKWARENTGNWPRRTLLGRVDDEGIYGVMVRSATAPTMPHDVAITDLALARLGKIDRKVLRAYYDYWEPIEALCKKLRMRHREFASVLKRARWRVALQIDQIEASEQFDTRNQNL